MTGERPHVLIAGVDEAVLRRERALPQPGSRQPAPGELVLLQSFLNTHFDLVEHWAADLLAGPDGLHTWFSVRGLIRPATARPTPAEVRRVLAIREGLRELAHHNREPGIAMEPEPLARMGEAATRVSIGLELARERMVLSPRGENDLDSGVAVLLAITARAMIDRTWHRLKACPGEHCGWVFYDHSRNNSSRWCSMAVCGGRAKARSHYRRRQSPPAKPSLNLG